MCIEKCSYCVRKIYNVYVKGTHKKVRNFLVMYLEKVKHLQQMLPMYIKNIQCIWKKVDITQHVYKIIQMYAKNLERVYKKVDIKRKKAKTLLKTEK